jgi:NADPH:quinone reductase
MRAIVVDDFGPPEQLRVGEVAEPMPGPSEVLVTVDAAPVNYVDLLVVGGTYQFLPPLPFVPGKGPAGVVTALGAEVTGLRVGDRVLAMAEQGGYAEAVAVPADQCYRLPSSMSFTEAASLSLVYDTAWFALRERARLETGETALVLGASGGVGQAAIQLAHAMGARVLAGILRPERARAVRAAGADAVIGRLPTCARICVRRSTRLPRVAAPTSFSIRSAARYSRRPCARSPGVAGWS